MGRSIFITGASSGIGRAVAFEFARRGYSLVLTARRLERLEEIRRAIQSEQPSIPVEIRFLDVTAYDTIPLVIREAAEALGGVDIVFANAGIGLAGKVGVGVFENARKTIETNLIGAMATVDAAVAYFMERGEGHIVGVSSVASYRGMPGNSAYCASKAGLSVYLEALRAELYRKNIGVTILYPGFIDTPINEMLPQRPFVIPVEKGAAIIARLIEKRVRSTSVPRFPWGLIGPLLKVLPTRVIAKMG
ncbi:MAG: SDR family oxidoreductase [Pseudomonadota bacterium]